MRRLLLIPFSLTLVNCSSPPQTKDSDSSLYKTSSHTRSPDPGFDLDLEWDQEAEMPKPPPNLVKAKDPNDQLSQALGMSRSPADLGFTEKNFTPCQMASNQPEACRAKYLSIVHFQLLCRETEGSVSRAPRRLMPIEARDVLWKLGNQSGHTRTDAWGYGQLSAISYNSARGQRLILKIGQRFVGFTASEVNKIVLPKNFCSS